MKSEMDRTCEAKILCFEGECTVERANEFKDALADELKREERLVLNLEKVTGVDLSFLQILCSVHRTSLRLNKHFSLQGERPEAFVRVVESAGYARSLGCHGDPRKACLWKEVASVGQDHNDCG